MLNPPATPSIKSALGHIAHQERLIEEWTQRRDEGDCTPDAETLTRWIGEAERDLFMWQKALERAELEAVKVEPLV